MKTGLLRLIATLVPLLAVSATAQEVVLEQEGLYSTRELTETASLNPGQQVLVRAAGTLRGSLVIDVHDQSLAVVHYFEKAHTTDRDRAVDYIDLIAVSFTPSSEGIRLDLRAPNPAPWENNEYGLIAARLSLPRGCRVEIEAVYFDIEASGPLTELVNTSSLGRLQASGVSDRLKLATANRRVDITDVSGDIAVSTTNSTVSADKITPRGATAYFRNDNGDIRLSNVTGSINVRTEYGRVQIDGFSPAGEKSYINGNLGPISIGLSDFRAGKLVVSNRYDDIEVDLPPDPQTVLSLAVDQASKIEVSGVVFRPELVELNRLSLVVGSGEGLISASVRGNGNIYVRGTGEEQ